MSGGTLLWGAIGFVLAYYVVSHYGTAGRVA